MGLGTGLPNFLKAGQTGAAGIFPGANGGPGNDSSLVAGDGTSTPSFVTIQGSYAGLSFVSNAGDTWRVYADQLASDGVFVFGGNSGSHILDLDQGAHSGNKRILFDPYGAGYKMGVGIASPNHALDLGNAWIDTDGSASFINFDIRPDGLRMNFDTVDTGAVSAATFGRGLAIDDATGKLYYSDNAAWHALY